MKYWMALAGLLFATTVAARHETLNYRKDDPFVFCTYGQINPDKCWWPISAATGMVMPNPACFPPTEGGRSWTADDTESLAEWYQVCTGVGQGPWKGTGTGEQVPFAH